MTSILTNRANWKPIPRMRKEAGALPEAALVTKKRLIVDSNAATQETTPSQRSKERSAPVLKHSPIDFELRTLDPNHPYLKERGFTGDTIRHFDLGYCNRGTLKGRISIPLRDPRGHLLGYAGRIADDALITGKRPKYLFSGSRDRSGVTLDFRESLFLYNQHFLDSMQTDLVVVEGFSAVWWLWQAGYRNVLGLMGVSCSAQQAENIVNSVYLSGRVWILTDGDDTGAQCAMSVLAQVVPHRFCRRLVLANGTQPTDYSAEQIDEMFY